MTAHLPLLAAVPPLTLPSLEVRLMQAPAEGIERQADVYDAPSGSRAPPTNPLY